MLTAETKQRSTQFMACIYVFQLHCSFKVPCATSFMSSNNLQKSRFAHFVNIHLLMVRIAYLPCSMDSFIQIKNYNTDILSSDELLIWPFEWPLICNIFTFCLKPIVV